MLVIHHLNESRSQRILWLMEELGVPHEVVFHTRDAKTRLAPSSLTDVHPLGKSPVLVDGDLTVIESGAIIDYVIRRHGEGRLAPDAASADFDRYQQWLHYAEGSAMLPLMLNMYVARLGEGGAPLQPRIQSEISNHLAFVDQSLAGREFFVGDSLTGADIQMSFVPEVAKAMGKLPDYPHMAAWIERMHARPAWKAALDKSGPYALGA
ncbi:glutathione S-transferase [Caulobacter sp. B11]|uniref:glutathione S-transferase family protein n=1 Tax=Caulobacter sp. B11 TaxID=2048899 RepID=UPI000C12A2E7|nr:glutathione S-transferase [Caulobacter sp. B11]PHY12592.1 glutathione S-transferase [Caulobacter sp. B11]